MLGQRIAGADRFPTNMLSASSMSARRMVKSRHRELSSAVPAWGPPLAAPGAISVAIRVGGAAVVTALASGLDIF